MNLIQKSFNFGIIIVLTVFTQILFQTTKADENVNQININENNELNSSYKLSPKDICYSDECLKFGRQFSKMINKSVDPCNDFYKFVCGKYSRTSKIPLDGVSVSLFSLGGEKVKNILREQLSKPYSKSDPLSIKYATDMYCGCIDVKTTESRGVQPLLEALKEIGGWPLIDDIIPFNEDNYNQMESLAHFIALYGENAIIDIDISTDWMNTTQNILFLGPATDLNFGFNIGDIVQDKGKNKRVPPPVPPLPEKLPKYKINFKKASQIDYLVNHILKMVVILGGKANNEKTQSVYDMFTFSSNLYKIRSNGLDYLDNYYKITLKEFEELSGNMSWLRLINRVYELVGSKKRFTYNDYCVVTDVEYFKKLPQLLFNTSKTDFANFLAQILVNDFGVYTVEAFRRLNFELFKEEYSIEKQQSRWKFCVSNVKNLLSFAVSRKYVKQYFSTKLKAKVTQLVEYIRDAFSQLIEKNSNLSEFSRKNALIKLKAIKDNVGYPQWLFDDKTLNSLYRLEYKCERKKFFECITYFMKRMKFTMLNAKDDPVNKEVSSWSFDPTILNAAYEPLYNSITISAAIITSLYGINNPRQLNYAKLGNILGHELTHGFDPSGNQFDERGNLNDIFDNITRLKLNENEMCFINQYNNYCDSGRCVNGELTIGENTADNGGMRETYKAYQTCSQYEGQPKRLPYMSEYTTNQIFFISYATLWCESMRKEYLPVIYNDVHSPNKFRVNGVLTNFQPFSDAFKCSNNSTLNAKNKCIVW